MGSSPLLEQFMQRRDSNPATATPSLPPEPNVASLKDFVATWRQPSDVNRKWIELFFSHFNLNCCFSKTSAVAAMEPRLIVESQATNVRKKLTWSKIRVPLASKDLDSQTFRTITINSVFFLIDWNSWHSCLNWKWLSTEVEGGEAAKH